MKALVAGKGFIGTKLGRKLKEEGHEVKYLNRKDADYSYDITNEFSIDDEFDVLYHTIGLPPGFHTEEEYREINVKGTRNLLDAVKADKVVYISALGVGESDHSFFTTKGEAEAMVMNWKIYTVVRPSTVIGEGNKLPEMIKKTALTRLFPDIQTRTQPIHVDDLVDVLVACADRFENETVDIAGPDTYTIGEMACKMYEEEGYSCHLVPFPTNLVEKVLGLSPLSAPFHAENRKLLEMENVTENNRAQEIVELQEVFQD